MKLSREYVLNELRAMEAVLADWVREIDAPTAMRNGEEVPLFPDGVPTTVPMDELGLPIDQFRAELAGVAGRIEALVTAG